MKCIAFILLLLLLAGQASANSYFKVTDVSPVHVYPSSEANFTVTLRSMGGDGAFAQPIFNTTKGLFAAAPGGLKYIVATGSRTYNCTIRAENITPGNYSFQVGVYAQSAPYSWRMAYVIVEAPMKSIDASATSKPQNANESQNTNESHNTSRSSTPQTTKTGTSAGKSGSRGMPGPGIILTLSALIIAARMARN